MANYNEDEAAAAAVACIYLLAALCSLGNVKLTGFSLYIPLGIASLMRGVAFAAAASFAATHNPDYLAVRGALQAVGLGISVAMCACFLVIWLRNAALGSRPPPAAARLASLAARAAVACVIVCGPLLGVAAVGLLYGGAGNPQLTKAGWDVRSASSAGFLAAAAAVVLLTGAVALHWLATALRANKQKQQQQQQEAAGGPAAGDGRIFVLLAAALLLLWATIGRQLSGSSHPELAAARHLQFPAVVLPELAVAVLWAWPRLAARVALASRYDAWHSEQQQQRAARRQKKQQDKEGCADVEASVADGGSNSFKTGGGAAVAAVAAAEAAV